MHFFTSITTNYLPKARVLANSVKRHNADAVFHLVLSDAIPDGFSLADEPFDSILTIDRLGIPDLDAWIFKHRLVELCTAVKGPAFIKIFESTDAEKLIYLDPDIVVLDALEPLSRMLDSASVILTPHVVEPDNSHQAILDNELCSLRHGVYNLGFLAIKKTEGGMAFLQWWRDRLLSYCYDDIPNGMFTDQKWVDLAPAFFDDVKILRDKTYNVATWNLAHRLVTAEKGVLKIEGEPIKFFHFSGFDSGDQAVMLKKYAPGNKALLAFRKWYISQMAASGQSEFGNVPCIYSTFSNGEKITDAQRLLYRSRKDLISAFPQPGLVTEKGHCYYRWFKANARKTDTAETQESQNGAHNDANQQLVAILNSWSWRMTRPLRWAKSWVAKIKRAIV